MASAKYPCSRANNLLTLPTQRPLTLPGLVPMFKALLALLASLAAGGAAAHFWPRESPPVRQVAEAPQYVPTAGHIALGQELPPIAMQQAPPHPHCPPPGPPAGWRGTWEIVGYGLAPSTYRASSGDFPSNGGGWTKHGWYIRKAPGSLSGLAFPLVPSSLYDYDFVPCP